MSHNFCSGRVQSQPTWGLGDSMNRTYEAIAILAQRIAAMENDESTRGVLLILELMNEPFAPALPGGFQQVTCSALCANSYC